MEFRCLVTLIFCLIFCAHHNQEEPNHQVIQNSRAFRDCPECPLMLPEEGSTYLMGSPVDESGRDIDECQHQETVSTFSIGVYEVTVEEYLQFADATNSCYPGWLKEGDPYNVETGSDPYYKEMGYTRNAKTLPICGVHRDYAVEYCKWLSNKTGKKYRLPLEKEWEYAARGGKNTRHYKFAGSNNLGAVGWYNANAGGKPHLIGEKAPNELGLYDMSGNLQEWCQDSWGPYPGCSSDKGVGGSLGVIRGGAFLIFDTHCRSADRVMVGTGVQRHAIGFRCVRDER